jgi:pimeloyl-ACP methyl ester carboxylesterase
LLVNPRGVGSSAGSIHPQGLIIDGDSLYQYAQSLGYPENRIDLYGHSMGGAIAAEVKSCHPRTGGITILDRTFSKVNTLARAYAPRILFGLGATTADWLCNASGWNFNNVKKVQSIQDPIYIFNHEYEEMVQYNADLLSACRSNSQKNVHLTELSTASPSLFPDAFKKRCWPVSDPHMVPLSLCYRKGDPLSATDTQQNRPKLCMYSLLTGPFQG